MLVFAFYLLKVIICSGILFGYYWLMLRNKIFHRYNRFYLLAAVLLSLAMPLIQIPIWHNADQPAPQAIKLLQAANSDEYLDEIIVKATQNNFSTGQAVFLFYLITSFIFLSLFIQTLIKIRRLFIRHRHSFIENVFFVNTNVNGTPFSFFRYIFWNDQIDPESPTGHQIFKHELAHVQQKHSYDKLFLNATLIFFWCNPFFWLIRKELNMIHEFMADKIAVEDSDTEAFAAMILQAAYPQHRFHLANSFFYSPIKRRLMMLTKNRNPKVGYIGRLMVLPLTVLVFAAFTLKAKTFKQSNQGYGGKTITVVIDAGHGGSDGGATSQQGTIWEKDLNLAIIKKIKSLNSNNKIKIVFTRETDIFQTVKEKAAFTKSINPDLFISIHMGAYPSTTGIPKSGLNVYVANNNSTNIHNSEMLASVLINEFNNKYELPVSQQPLRSPLTIRVLQDAVCPAVLIEAGYITNNKDLAYLQTEGAKEIIAGNILAAVEKYGVANEKGVVAGIDIPATSSNENVVGKKTDTMPEIILKNHEKALIILDGKTISNEELKRFNPQNIKSVNILKGEEGIAQFGDKGRNGVLIIATKVKNTERNDLKVTIRSSDSAAKVLLSNVQRGSKKDSIPAFSPLFVIDGKIQRDGFKISGIDPNDIESIHVIKDKTAIEKYGDRTINGVIEIITKSKNKTLEITRAESSVKNLNEVVAVGYVINRNQEPVYNVGLLKTDDEPSFPGGASSWRKYLEKHLNPQIPIQEGWKPGEYKITVSFIVSKDGTISGIRTTDFPGSKTSEHCIDLIRKGPRWVPAMQNGVNVIFEKKQPFTFIIADK